MSNNTYFCREPAGASRAHRSRRRPADDDGQREGLPGDARLLQAGSERSQRHRSDRVFDLAGRRLPGGAEPARLPVRHGARRRRLDHAAAEARLPLHRRRDHFARRALPRVRRAGRAAPCSATVSASSCSSGSPTRSRTAITFTPSSRDRRSTTTDRARSASLAPSVDGHAEVGRDGAGARAASNREACRYVEAHGTGTALGDPIEVAALTQAFRPQTRRHGVLRARLGEDEHRPSRRRRRRRRADQDRPGAAAPYRAADPALHSRPIRSWRSRRRRSSSTPLRSSGTPARRPGAPV